MSEFLSGLDRKQIIRWTAVYLVIYAVIGACGGLVLGIVGALSVGVGALTNATVGTQEGTAAVAIGGLSIIMALLYIIAIPLCAVGAFGLFRRKTWARNAAVIALGFTVLISLVGLTQSFGNILWAIISAFGIYLFWSDEGIKQELSQ